MDAGRAIGVFDSGVGGLTVLKALRERLPAERFLYYADLAHCPYGGQTSDAIRERATRITTDLVEAGCKLVVVACNTATIAAIAHLRSHFDLPFVGMEPAVKPACAATRSGVIGVLATEASLGGDKFQQLVAEHGAGIQVVMQACPGLVECVERGILDGPEVGALLGRYLEPMQRAGADVIVLGCTHYPYLRPQIEKLAGPGVTVIDTGDAVARQADRLLGRFGLHSTNGMDSGVEWLGSGNIDQLDDFYRRLLLEKTR